ncbi:ureidoglycolate dehydrogenase [Salmonella enterica subsp. enterica]|uniref:Ureidoglycolate dehydrogenase n=1 Tax=Salmonella enterica I TaxID=59201 RepID=A0A379X016_SALET|nr:ureidoglycolate dehydrogenase [Salmonella enterica subsp. enterica]
MKISRETLHQLIENKLYKAGLKREHAATVADVLVYADARGIHSHGAVRVEYYAERISKGGTNREPTFRIENTGPCTAILHADNAAGQVAAKMGMEHAIEIAKKNGVAVVGISRMGHSGAISYFVRQAAREGLIGLSICQSDPMVVRLAGRIFTMALIRWPLPRRAKAMTSLLRYGPPCRPGEKSLMHGPAMSPFRRVGPLIKTARRHMILLPSMRYYPPQARKVTA